jgi:flagellar protein FlaH
MGNDGHGKESKGIEDIFSIHIKQDELAKRLGGGLPRGAIVLIEGVEGSGRSVLCQRLAYGTLNNGASVTYISTELTMREFIDQMYSLSYKISDHLISGKLVFVPVYPLLGNSRPRGDFLSKLVNTPNLYDRDLLIVDTISALAQDKLDQESGMALVAFLKKMARLGKTIVLSGEPSFAGLASVRLAADVYLSLDMKVTGGGINRTVGVKRFLRARMEVGESFRYRIEPKVGMVIEITEVSG